MGGNLAEPRPVDSKQAALHTSEMIRVDLTNAVAALASSLLFSNFELNRSASASTSDSAAFSQAIDEKAPDMKTVGPIVVIQLHGEVGVSISEPNDAATKSFTAAYLKRKIDEAKKLSPSAIVLDIDGPGGLVVEEKRILELLLKTQRDEKIRIVAFAQKALSAWSQVALACREIVVTGSSKVGAAVTIMVQGNEVIEAPEGDDAVSQKFASTWKATLREIHSFTGRCECLMAAMTTQKAELWWHPSRGLSANMGEGDGWERLDDEVGVCCLNSAEMLKTGIALGEAANPQDLPKAIGLPGAKVLLLKVGKDCEFTDRVKDLRSRLAKAKNLLEMSIVQDEEGNTTVVCGMLKPKRRPQGVDVHVQDPNVLGGVARHRALEYRAEDLPEAKDRFRNTLRKARNCIPDPKIFADAADLSEILKGIRDDLDQAYKSAGKAEWESVVSSTYRAGQMVLALLEQ